MCDIVRSPHMSSDAAPESAPEPSADYWSRAARLKTFAHELDLSRLSGLLPPQARILDVGCGWGRSMSALRGGGYRDVVGLDFAEGMLARGRPTIRRCA